MNPRIVFMGSPEFALPSLDALLAAFDVVGVVTQPDRQAGRGQRLAYSAVKTAAERAGLPVFQPGRIRAPEAVARLREWEPDLFVVAAFGQILSQELLDLPAHGSINVHASLLPRWRGASPIQHAILHGDGQAGVTIMQMDAGLDTGPILSQVATAIEPADTGETLSARLARLGADLLAGTIPGFLAGRIAPLPQPGDGVTLAPLLKKSDGRLDLDRPAPALARQVRAFHPWPGAFLELDGSRLKIQAASAQAGRAAAGIRTVVDGLPAVGTGEGTLVLHQVQPPGKKSMPGDAFLLGARDWAP